ncbi:Anthranilate 1,2-dioxygenase ferredoxin subunit [Stieleria maiorica]|uniref:Anthranilate 1,2-dioxygenase ferredoxin subunit n=1 Tax=Stieleria maiorica TaxID=2795974 RepID=A0A5B9MHB7_9BACT|nr:Rieske (2Fe-2S) protein [Stieleria maiorica]QEF98477.1 Anthranilate 1,2-dioxygenase ferredoxin subunit [Stieleria maiorica]
MEPDSQNTWIDVASADRLSDGQAIEVVVGEHIIAIFRDGDSLYAIDGLCAHQGGPVAKGELSQTDAGKTCVTCPWHGWQYELATGIQTVNRQPLQRTFPVREKDGRLEVQI